MIFIEIGLYPLIKINIYEWLFNYLIYNPFLTKLHEIFLKHTKTFKTFLRALRETGLHGRSARKQFFVSAKNRKLKLSFAKSMINNLKHTVIISYLLTKAKLTFLVPMVELLHGEKKK